jgi:CBS domain-containing protein
MSASLELSNLPLRAVLRPAPVLSPEDTVARFVQATRFVAANELPVVESGRLVGVASLADAVELLAIPGDEDREIALRRPLSSLMRPAEAVARTGSSSAEIGKLCAQRGINAVPVVDEDGYCLGIVRAVDLLLPEAPVCKPGLVGGMATPFGVYLTNGSLQAGAGNLALVASGALMGLLILLTIKCLSMGMWAVHICSHLPYYPVFDVEYDPPAGHPMLGIATVAARVVVFAVFLLLLKMTRVAGYHGAEHQTVHALERGEPLTMDVVRRMPRAHPRCGTNLLAAGVIFFSLDRAFGYLPVLNQAEPVLAALATLVTWRQVGAFLQERFTTRPATDRQIQSGIDAATELLEKYRQSEPSRPRLFRRIWCMGLLQTMVGSVLLVGAVILVEWIVSGQPNI